MLPPLIHLLKTILLPLILILYLLSTTKKVPRTRKVLLFIFYITTRKVLLGVLKFQINSTQKKGAKVSNKLNSKKSAKVSNCPD